MKKGTAIITICFLLSALLMLASCSSGEKPAATSTVPTTKAPTTTTATTTKPVATMAKPAATKPAGPLYGGTVIFSAPREVQGFDDGLAIPYNNFTLHLTNPTLLKGKWQAGLAGTGEIDYQICMPVPLKLIDGWVAEKWEIPDDQTIIFHIRKGIRWENKPPVNGRELNAHDVTFTLNRLFSPETAGNYVERQHPDKKRPVSIIATDDWTVVTKWPKGEVGPALRTIGFEPHIVAPELLKEHKDLQDWKVGVGCGPFLLTDYVSDSSVTLVKNPNYWEIDPLNPSNKLPYVDTFRMVTISDESTRNAGLVTGKLDLQYGGYSTCVINSEAYERLRKSGPQLEWAKWGGYLPNFIFMRTDKPELPYSNVKVRQALSMGLNRQEIVDSYHGGEATLLAYPVSPSIKDLYVPMDKLSPDIRKLWEYHPDEAKKLLAEAGYPNGFKTSILCLEEHVQLLSVVKHYWATIGVDLTLDVKEAGVYQSIYSKVGHEEMLYRGLNMAQPDKMNPWRPKTTANLSVINDPKMIELYNVILANFLDEDKWKQAFREQMNYMQEQCWMLQMPVPNNYACWQPWINNYYGNFEIGYHSGGRFLWAQYIWVDPAERKAAGF